MNGVILAIIGLATWVLIMHVYYMPRFKRFVMALKAADASTWIAIRSPDGTMFGSPSVPQWGCRMMFYVWRRRYEKFGNEDLRFAGKAIRPVVIAARVGILAWIALVVLFGRGAS